MSTGNRLATFQRVLQEKDVAAAILLSSRDIYYFAGTAQQSTLLIPAQGEPVLLVARDYQRAREESSLRDVRPSTNSAAIKDAILEKGLGDSTIGLVQDNLPTAMYRKLVEMLPKARFVDVTRSLRTLRMVKDADEIERIRRAAAIADIGHEIATQVLRPGISELEAALEIELAMVRSGHDGYCLPRNLADVVRAGGVVSGPNLFAPSALPTTMPGPGSSPVVPYGPSRRKIAQGDVVVVDLGGAFDGYIADEARTYTLGKPTAAQKEIADAVQYIIQETLCLFRPGTTASDIYRAAQVTAKRTPYKAYFLGGKERNVRFVGHGVGIELDELPMLAPGDDTVLRAGMVLAYEPIIMVPGLGAATMENTLLITEDGHEILTKRPLDLIEL